MDSQTGLPQLSVADRVAREFSHAYAEQNDRDYRSLRKAVKSGRIIAQRASNDE